MNDDEWLPSVLVDGGVFPVVSILEEEAKLHQLPNVFIRRGGFALLFVAPLTLLLPIGSLWIAAAMATILVLSSIVLLGISSLLRSFTVQCTIDLVGRFFFIKTGDNDLKIPLEKISHLQVVSRVAKNGGHQLNVVFFPGERKGGNCERRCLYAALDKNRISRIADRYSSFANIKKIKWVEAEN